MDDMLARTIIETLAKGINPLTGWQEILLLLPDERYHLITAFDKFLHFLCRTLMLNRVDAVLLEVLQRTGKELFL